MSVLNADLGLGARSAGEERMPQGIALSAALHLGIALLVVFGLPVLFHQRIGENAPIAVRLVTIGPHTRATHPNPEMPHRHAKPVKPVPGPPLAKPQPKPAPPSPAPPPSAAAPKPQPAPPLPKPVPKAAAKTAEPAPPLPQSKPLPPPPKPLAAVTPPLPAIKPTPPRERVKEEPRTEQKKYNPALFESLLKNLAPNPTAPSREAPPQRDRAPSGRASSQPKAPLGALSASEIDLIRAQIERCWDVPAGARDAKDLVVVIRVSLNPDGSVRQARIMDEGRMQTDPYFRAAAESARRALFNPECTPLRLPPDQYRLWKTLVLNFSPKDIL